MAIFRGILLALQSKPNLYAGKRFLVAALACLAWTGCTPAFADPAAMDAQVPGAAAPSAAADAAAHQQWEHSLRQVPQPGEGCFHATYPNLTWNKVQCGQVSGYRSAPPRNPRRGLAYDANGVGRQVVGNGSDYAISAPSGYLLNEAAGSFTATSNLKSEKGVGVAAFGYGGITGSNQYTLQLNTNFYNKSRACSGSSCFSWQQYILVSDDVNAAGTALTGTSDVFIQTWLIDYGSGGTCPSGFNDAGADSEGPGEDCYRNSPATVVAKQLPITALPQLQLSGSAKTSGTDSAIVIYNNQAYSSSVADTVSDIAAGWSSAEFNVVGNAGGSRAVFNIPSSLTVKVAGLYGTTAAPGCLGPSGGGTTGETNNYTLGSCTKKAGTSTTAIASAPYIQFTESN
ncbi:hypothetical protein NFI95_07555 [Acetobacteraceae bacterium KSS8]|uniref:Secreted protein n=1 Tax=Endosaccharibacter trunci TaxID=2812733 RepID=A0ABT1W627_9PROT|nr:hypothetical protein [Acetobacteraceae bacterium KSS8]